MSPSIFNNEYSRGPLYQYWKERSAEEKGTRDQRVEEAKIRSKGFQPLSPAPGPSSQGSYMRRATSGPPGYATATATAGEGSGRGGSVDGGRLSQAATAAAVATPQGGELPSYHAASGPPPAASDPAQQGPSTNPEDPPLLSAADEKARLAQWEAQRHQIEDDAAIARTLSSDATEEEEEGADVAPERQMSSVSESSQGAGRRKSKSAASKVGRWLADAASGYSKKQERF